ncbi:MAG: alpha/beta hydrolase [Candidatus Lokiarchaeota archaeon]|nr:alpha/beta hydrolase [Candidatus Lokiarchaeota archaeon]
MNKHRIIKVILAFLCFVVLVVGVVWAFMLFFGGRVLKGITIVIEQYVAQSSVLIVGLCIAVTILLLKLLASRKINHPKQYYAIIIIGLTISGLNAASLLATPYTIINTNQEFDTAFDLDWENSIPSNIYKYFLPSPYFFSSHFLSIPEREIIVEKDVLFYTGENITLYFDVYRSKMDASQLPGNGSIIINLHPGAWMSGGKGTWNMISTSKYLAGQGYVVFDIEYGLIDWFEYAAEAPDTPEYVMGNFTIEDQIRHIGIFTNRCASEFAATYGGNLDCVYFMGRSAGAHLGGVAGLGYNNDFHNTTFSPNITVKGVIPLYPPSAAPEFLLKENKTTNPDLYNAYDLVHLADPQDPPVLIFQGTSDGQVWIERVIALEANLESKGVKCCLVKFPFAGHANDFVLSSNIGQVWSYYLERFLYLTQHIS